MATNPQQILLQQQQIRIAEYQQAMQQAAVIMEANIQHDELAIKQAEQQNEQMRESTFTGNEPPAYPEADASAGNHCDANGEPPIEPDAAPSCG